MKKFKFFALIFLIVGLIAGKYIVFDYPISRGKRAGNLTKISKKGKFIKTWEGTIDEGFGDKLTSYFSVKDEKVAVELFNLKQRQVVVFYEEYLSGWPRDTNYNVVAWEPLEENNPTTSSGNLKTQSINSSNSSDLGTNSQSIIDSVLSKTLFCVTLGTLLNDGDLYLRVKNYLKDNNLYIYNQIKTCNSGYTEEAPSEVSSPPEVVPESVLKK